MPLRPGTEATAAALLDVFKRASFSEHSICERLRIASLDGVDLPLFKSLEDRLEGAGLLARLARVFVFGRFVDRPAMLESMSEADLAAFLDTDLLRAEGGEGDATARLFSPVRLVPIAAADPQARDLLLVGDRGDHPDGAAFTPFRDIVFSGHNPLTRQFLKLLPQTDRAAVLDLCAGSGVAALAMATHGAQATAADIAERSAHFARFNAWLNQCPCMTVVCGDLYDAVAGQRFDCIVAHPPYVPALSQSLTYRDGGATGDEIIRGVVEGLPRHLNPGGTFHLLCLAMDTGEGNFEERVRTWLGPDGREFDLVFALDSTTPPELIATRIIDRSSGSPDDLNRWRALFEQLQVKVFVYGAIAGRRFVGDGDAFTRRVLMTDSTTNEGFEWLFRWFDWLRQPGGVSQALDVRATLPGDLRLDVQHRVDAGAFVPGTYFLENGSQPFRARLATEAWVVALLGELDGTRTVRDVFESASKRGRVPPGFSELELGRLMSYLMERGCVTAPR